jgi:hypothetical protein
LSQGDCQRLGRDLGIVTVLDLRAPATASEFPSKLGARSVNLALVGDEAESGSRSTKFQLSPRSFMRRTRDRAAEAVIASIFGLLADESSYPLVFHCEGGKDRTGLIAALVLGVLGVADQEIARDYAMTEPNMARTIDRMRTQGRMPADGSFPEIVPRTFFETPPAAMLSLLSEIRGRHGSVRGYVTSCGVDAATLAGIEHALLTGGGGT